jgi:hypothetical protein
MVSQISAATTAWKSAAQARTAVLTAVMAELGWTAVRVCDLTRGGYKDQVRGYLRDARAVQ